MQGDGEAPQPCGVLFVVGGVATDTDVVEVGVERGAVDDRLVGQRLERGRDVLVTFGAESLGEKGLSECGGVGGQSPADPVRCAGVLLGLPRREVHDVGSVEPADVEGLVQVGTKVVEERGDQRQVRIAVQITGADQQRPHTDRVHGARRVGAHPTLRDECT